MKLRQALRQRGVYLDEDQARMLLAIALRATQPRPIRPLSHQEEALLDRFRRRCEELR